MNRFKEKLKKWKNICMQVYKKKKSINNEWKIAKNPLTKYVSCIVSKIFDNI